GHAARSLHWFNPLAFAAMRRLREEQERACDDRVLSAGLRATDYARHLCDVANSFRSTPSPEWATLAMARPSNLERRVVAILDVGAGRHAARRPSCVAAAMMIGLVLPLSALRLAAIALPPVPAAERFVFRTHTAPAASLDGVQPTARTFMAREASRKES